MTEIEKIINSAREHLKGLVTADNTEGVSKCVSEIDKLEQETKKLADENLALKDKIVEMVKGTISTKEPEKDLKDEKAPLSMEDAVDESLQEIVNARKK